MAEESISYPPLNRPKEDKELFDFDSFLECNSDIIFPVFAFDDYKLDVQRCQSVVQRALSLPPTEFPRYEDRQYFADFVTPYHTSLIERGDRIIRKIASQKSSQSVSARKAVESGALLQPEPKEAGTGSSPLHKEFYLPPGGTGVPYKPGSSSFHTPPQQEHQCKPMMN
jgi:hypothetical protein